MKVLVTGSDGYIGTLLAPALAARGHDVTGLDTGFYAEGNLYDADVPEVPTRRLDTRQITADALREVEAVVHLAELSNDPLGQLNPALTFRVNHEGSVRLARLAREAGVRRFVYASSCSVYGVGGDTDRDETSPVNPQTAYAECKALVERDVAALAAESFSPTFLRNATAFGPSPRMRFDIVLNNLAGLAWTERAIRMSSDGTPWRPLVHLLDIADAVAAVLEAPIEAVHNEIFNVGDDHSNYRVREIADIVAREFPGCELHFGQNGADNRSYRVCFAKIREHLPAFRCSRSACDGARQLRRVFEAARMTRETFESAPYTRLKQLERLLASGQLDRELFWT